jgi:hypothetical protein
MLPPNSVKLDLRRPSTETEPLSAAQPSPGMPAKSPLQRANEARQPARRQAKIERKPSWWAARATAGEVTPGFTKAEILKQAPEDPRGPDGVLKRVTDLLEDLGS